MAREDISYDFEDFGMTADQLDEKYNPDGDGEHPEYTKSHWYNDNTTVSYWDWVVYRIKKDDESIEGQPEPAPAPANTIETLDQFAAVIARWHIKGMKQAEHMLEMPEGYVTEYVAKEGDEPIQIELKGDLLIAFRMGVMTGVDAFGALPFTYSLDEAAVEPEQEDGTATGQ